MAGIPLKTPFAICALLILAFSLSGRSGAQSNALPTIDSPSQRWLPPPRSYPNQPDSQAKLLSSLRDLVLNSRSTKESNPSRLSDADVQSLKEAMKQYGGNLPDGLSADSLDAIPPELISKALSNPELMRQAKELSEQFMKADRPKSADDPNRPVDSASNKTPPNTADKQQPSSKQNNNENKFKPSDVAPQSQKPKDGLESQSKTKKEDFTDLMEKLRNTQQQFEQGQNASNGTEPPKDRSNANKQPSSSNNVTPRTNAPSRAKTAGSAQPGSAGSGSAGSSDLDRSEPALRPGAMPSTQNRPSPRQSQADRNGQSPRLPQDESNPFDSIRNQQPKAKDLATDTNSQSTKRPSSSPGNDAANRDTSRSGAADRADESKSTPSMDIRKELDRRGFGPTLQKIIEDAQRSSQSSRVVAQPPNGTEPQATKTPNEKTTQPATPEPIKQSSPRPPNPANTAESIRRPAKPDSAMSKSFQETGKYLTNLWTQVSKSSQSTPRAAATPSPRSTPQASSTNEAFWLPNPFNAQVLEGLIVLAIAGAITFFAFRYRFRSEQVRRELLEAQLAPRIDEIRSRDDVVRAFHALAKQRFKSAQAWWTYGYVTEQFQLALPEHSTPIRTLSSLYEQARYFPTEHQLTTDQIEDAKSALKQCEG